MGQDIIGHKDWIGKEATFIGAGNKASKAHSALTKPYNKNDIQYHPQCCN
jgi:hypothetical protein